MSGISTLTNLNTIKKTVLNLINMSTFFNIITTIKENASTQEIHSNCNNTHSRHNEVVNKYDKDFNIKPFTLKVVAKAMVVK